MRDVRILYKTNIIIVVIALKNICVNDSNKVLDTRVYFNLSELRSATLVEQLKAPKAATVSSLSKRCKQSF